MYDFQFWMGLAAKIDRVTVTNSITQQSDRSQVCEYSLQTKRPIGSGWSHSRRYNRFDSVDDDDSELSAKSIWLHKSLTDCLDFAGFRFSGTHKHTYPNAGPNAKSSKYDKSLNFHCSHCSIGNIEYAKIFHLQRADLNMVQAFNYTPNEQAHANGSLELYAHVIILRKFVKLLSILWFVWNVSGIIKARTR